MDSYNVRFWDTKKISDNGSGGRYRVRWAVDGREHCKSFKARPLADGFLAGLKDAVRDRRPFSPRTGLPAAESRPGVTAVVALARRLRVVGVEASPAQVHTLLLALDALASGKLRPPLAAVAKPAAN